MTLGKRIKARRIECGLSVDELAEKLGKNRATVYRYESDTIEMPAKVLHPLAEALNTTPGYLMGWTNDYYDYERDLDSRLSVISPAWIRQCRDKGLSNREIWALYGETINYWHDPLPEKSEEDVELTEYLETLRTRPECRMLFSLIKDATKEDVEKAVAIITALRGLGGNNN